jgi:hypothetical protein
MAASAGAVTAIEVSVSPGANRMPSVKAGGPWVSNPLLDGATLSAYLCYLEIAEHRLRPPMRFDRSIR